MSHYVSVSSATEAGLVLTPTTWQQFTDFANILKAFIGTSYLALPFAFKQSGLALGIAALVLIAIITDHCCQMIIKCKNAAVKMILDSSTHYQELQNEQCFEEMRRIKNNVEMEMTLGDIGNIAIGRWGIRIVNVALVLTQTGFCVAYFVFIGNTLKEMFPVQFKVKHMGNSTHQVMYSQDSGDYVPLHTPNYNTKISNSSNMIPPIYGIETAPAFALLLLIPLPFLVLMSFIRKIRKLGPISGLANIALLVGFFGLLVHMLRGLHFKLNDIELDNWITFPVFFGQLTCAYEGIGCIIPIESDMGANRPRFPLYLHLTLAQVSVILGSFGVLGYLIYGNNVPQIVTDTLPQGVFGQLVRVTLILAVLFTYPLQLFPVIQIAESLVFKRMRKKRKSHMSEIVAGPSGAFGRQEVKCYDSINQSTENPAPHDESVASSESEPLKKDDEQGLQYKTSAWKRNLLRLCLVLASAGLAVLFKDDFAYINALIGSLGCSVLAYILPCVFHLVLFKDTNSGLVVVKNISLIVFGIVGGIVGVVVTVQTIVKDFSRHKG